MNQLDKIKTHVKENKAAYFAGAWASLVGATTVIVVGRMAENEKSIGEPARLVDSRHIVLENVGDQNLWFDMDEPDNYYRLEGVATALE